MSLWSLGASLSVGAIVGGYSATLGEVGSHRHGRGGDERGGFVVKIEQKQGLQRTVRPPTGEAPSPQIQPSVSLL